MEHFKTVADLLADESRWCKEAVAMTTVGQRTWSGDEDACRWCLYGAVFKVYPERNFVGILEKLTQEIGCDIKLGSLGRWNDAPERTHAEVLELVRKAGV